MKSLIRVTLVSCVIVLLGGCDNKKANSQEQAQKQESEVITAKQISSATDAQKEAYALGSSYAAYIKESLQQAQLALDSESEYILQGFTDTYQGKSQLTEDETKDIIKAFSERHQKEAAARLEKEIKENVEAGNAFRDKFIKQSGVKKTKSGLLYKVEKSGSSTHPNENDVVVVNYTGSLIDGRKFDSSYDRGEAATFPLQGVIKGWIEGIQLIGVGGKIKLVIPPELAYGNQSIPAGENTPGIPAASTLIFDVELVAINDESH